ncbi:hypothetical protein ACRYCC_42760 [Actinomadura scrupuli]|uniref:hypothetical protein n=1 Tax=Actinomadura scrupuli TaxID=559629 RepID=UPI003D955F05
MPTAPLPRLPGIPAGRYFIADVDPTGQLTARSVTALSQGWGWWTVTPLDSHGHPVTFTAF